MDPTPEVERSLFDGLTAAQQARLTELLDEYICSLEQGQPLSHEELAAREPELAGVLKTYLDSLDFLQDAAAGFTPTGESLEFCRPEELDGKQLGDFTIRREIGRGGMGIVYEAWQNSLDRRVALKMLPFAALLDSKQIARFRNEAQAAAQLHHPHIVPVFAVGSQRGVHYYAMQLIDGRSLDDIILSLRGADGAKALAADNAKPAIAKYSVSEPGFFRAAAKLGVQAAEALHAAHEFGIIHRDIKPSNLLVDDDGELWVTDFGLARCRTEANLTRTGDFVGTMRYMSPEQTKARSEMVDFRTDIYSLGVTLYELVTLKHAVRGEDPADIVRQLDTGHPYRPRIHNPSIPADLENVIQKAMAKSRDERYATARELADDLQRFLDGKPTIAKSPTALEIVSKWIQRHRRVASIAVAILALASIGLTVSTVLLRNAQKQTEQALAKANENYRQYRSQLGVSKSNLAVLQFQNGDTAAAEHSFQQAIRLLRDALAENPKDTESRSSLAAALTNACVVYEKTNPELALQCYQEASALQQQLVDAAPEKLEFRTSLALTCNNLGSFYRRRQKFDAAVSAFRQSIKILENACRLVDGVENSGEHIELRRDLAVSFHNLGMTYRDRGDLDDARKSLQQAVNSLEESGASNDHQRATAQDLSSLAAMYNNLGMVLEDLHDYRGAAGMFRSAVRHQSSAIERSPDVSRYGELLATHQKNLARVDLLAKTTDHQTPH